MREFTSTDLANKTGDVLDAAAREFVDITRHGKSRFVIMSRERFDRMRSAGDPRRAHRIDDMPEEDAALLESALKRALDDD